MAKFRLRTYDQIVRGGYIFEQYGQKTLKFGPEPVIEAVARQVWKFRMANGLPRATYREAVEDVDQFNCRARGNDPSICIEVTDPDAHVINMMENTPGISGPCKGCGAPVVKS